MICACCNSPVDPDWAKDHNLCPVCHRSGCTAFHACHSDGELVVHEENERKKRASKGHKTDSLAES